MKVHIPKKKMQIPLFDADEMDKLGAYSKKFAAQNLQGFAIQFLKLSFVKYLLLEGIKKIKKEKM